MKRTITVNLRDYIEQKIEAGIGLGWRRTFKHYDDPSEMTAIETITRSVMEILDESVEF
jgi:hypothetical protein